MKLYFLSENNMDNKTLEPRVPKNFLTKNGYEDNTTKRVCFSESIAGALSALSMNLDGKELYVHIAPENVKYTRPTKSQVPDIAITKERWVLNPVTIKCIGKILVHDDGKEGKEYTYGDNKKAILYTWDYEWIEKQAINESYIINEKDILYNKDKFDSGEINLCFITGLSGSGKSTLAHSKENDKVEAYELDDVICYIDKFTDDQLKEYGDLIYSYFKGPGKKYRFYSNDERNEYLKSLDKKYKDEHKSDIAFWTDITTSFCKYAIQYANSHKDKKFFIEGVWIVEFIDWSILKPCAVYIKGTSVLISRWRAAKRDSQDAPNKKERNRARWHNFFSSQLWNSNSDFEKKLKSFRNYFKSLMKEEK